MDTEALNAAVLQLLRVLGKAPAETDSVTLDALTGVTWAGMEGECIVTRNWPTPLRVGADA